MEESLDDAMEPVETGTRLTRKFLSFTDRPQVAHPVIHRNSQAYPQVCMTCRCVLQEPSGSLVSHPRYSSGMLSHVLNESVLRTTRLTLSRPRLEDVDALHVICSDPRVWTHLPSGRHRDASETSALVRTWIAEWERDGTGVSVVRRRGSSETLGYAGCAMREGGFWNLGYRMSPEVHGQGFAREASLAAMERAAQLRPRVPVTAIMLEHNVASAGVARSVGLTLVGRAPDAAAPGSMRLLYADRALTDEQRQVALS